MRTLVRTQTETTPAELPDSTIDWYLRQAYDRTIALENQWPFFEKRWELTLPNGEHTLPIPGDMNIAALESVMDVETGLRLVMIDMGKADEWFAGLNREAGVAYAFYVPWAGDIRFYPEITFDENRTFYFTGWRLATDWISNGPDAEPDADERLHRPLIHYAIALAYEQQEDEQLGTQYMGRYDRDVMQARSAIMEPSIHRPAMMGPRAYTGIGPQRVWPAWRIKAP